MKLTEAQSRTLWNAAMQSKDFKSMVKLLAPDRECLNQDGRKEIAREILQAMADSITEPVAPNASQS